jgi:hypothetical protein
VIDFQKRKFAITYLTDRPVGSYIPIADHSKILTKYQKVGDKRVANTGNGCSMTDDGNGMSGGSRILSAGRHGIFLRFFLP